ncbi:MAG: GNAT family N-acetyltransferase [Thermoplasmatales archaeon]|nr:GNAT family N-acetyltransferase [Thermoplasmatales archaeon]
MDFVTKKERKIEIREPIEKDYIGLKNFINSLVKENAFISKNKFVDDETELNVVRKWLNEMKRKERVALVAFHNSLVVGFCDLKRKKFKEKHVGEIGISVRKGYRREGIGRKLMEETIKLGKRIGIKLVILRVFKANKNAISLYKKLGFKKYGLLPKGIKHKGKYVDIIEMYKWVR